MTSTKRTFARLLGGVALTLAIAIGAGAAMAQAPATTHTLMGINCDAPPAMHLSLIHISEPTRPY